MMKKTALFLALVLSVSMAATCSAEEAKTEGAAEVEMVEQAEAPAVESNANIVVGAWYPVGRNGNSLKGVPTGECHVFPDGTVTVNGKDLGVSLILAENGTFTVDTAGIEEAANMTFTGEVTPVTQESLDQYNVKKGDNSWLNYDSCQLILTASYPDPSNPLATSPAVTTFYFLRETDQHIIPKEYMYQKVWKIGENVLAIDAEGNMSLNDGAATGKLSSEAGDDSQYISSVIRFRWDNGGTIKYNVPLFTADTIQLQNVDKPEEVLELKLEGAAEAAEPAEEAAAPAEEAAEPAEEAAEPAEVAVEPVEIAAEPAEEAVENPFIGTWELVSVTKNGTEIPAKELLQADSLTAEVAEDGMLTLTFDNGFSTSIEPVYEESGMTVQYQEFNNDMTWTAVMGEDGTVTAEYADLAITLSRAAN